MADKERANSKQYPELNLFESPEEAKKSYKALQKRLMKSPKFWLVLVGYSAGIGLIVTVILICLRPWFPLNKAMFGGIVGGVTGGSASGVSGGECVTQTVLFVSYEVPGGADLIFFKSFDLGERMRREEVPLDRSAQGRSECREIAVDRAMRPAGSETSRPPLLDSETCEINERR